jgi:hypothetical protein
MDEGGDCIRDTKIVGVCDPASFCEPPTQPATMIESVRASRSGRRVLPRSIRKASFLLVLAAGRFSTDFAHTNETELHSPQCLRLIMKSWPFPNS